MRGIGRAFGATLAEVALAAAVAPQAALAATGSGTQEMYRLYNPYSGEHFYTASADERDHLDGIGWDYEGVGWVAPKESSTPVYRLYNPYAGDHHYTTSAHERDYLDGIGWSYEGVGWYSDDAEGVPIHRLYNPYASTATHHYTASAYERDYLDGIGWNAEGVGWYGVDEGASSGGEEAHDHKWSPVYATRTVVDKEAWDEPVYKTVTTMQCGFCGEKFASADSNANLDAFLIHNDTKHGSEANYVNKDEQIQVDTIHHPAETHEEEYVSGYRCSCGATRGV